MLFDRFIGFLSKTRGKKHNKAKKFNSYSKFKQYLSELNKNDEAYSSVSYSAELCDEALEIIRKRLIIMRQIRNLDEKLNDLECYNALSDDDADYLKNMLERTVALSDERKQLMYQITDFDSALIHLIDYIDEVPTAITQMTEAENKQRLLRQDIGLLEGEKADLEHERENLEYGADFIYKFSIFSVVLFTIATFTLAFLVIFRKTDVFYPLAILVFIVIFVCVLIYILRRKIRYELALNLKMLKRAVDLLNKKTVLYAHYTNFLRFTCKKYKVKNALMLNNNFKDLSHYQHLTGRLDSITNIMFQTETQLENFLRSKHIHNVSSTNLKLAKTLDIDDKKRYYTELSDEKINLEKNLAVFDARHEEIWSQLVELNNSDKTKTSIIERIIKTYFDEVGRIVELAGTEAIDQPDPPEEERIGTL